VTAFSGADANAIVHGQYKDFAVANLTLLSRLGGGQNGVDRWLNKVVVDSDLQLNFTQQVKRRIGHSLRRNLPALPPETLTINDCQTENLNFGQSQFNGFKSVRLDDSDNQLHDAAAYRMPLLNWFRK
jgi:hypothetical protein